MTEQFFILVAVITGLTEAIKRAGLDTRYAPIFALIVGFICTYLFIGKSTDIILQGIVASLTASGLYSGVKKSVSK